MSLYNRPHTKAHAKKSPRKTHKKHHHTAAASFKKTKAPRSETKPAEATPTPPKNAVLQATLEFQQKYGKIFYPVLTATSVASFGLLYGAVHLSGHDFTQFFSSLPDHKIMGGAATSIWNAMEGPMQELIRAEPQPFAELAVTSVAHFMTKPIRYAVAFRIAKAKVAEQEAKALAEAANQPTVDEEKKVEADQKAV